MFTFSEQPCSDMWNHIRFLSKKSNCKRLLKGEIKSGGIVYYADGSKLDKKVDQISMCINQASEYFIAANQVSINTSPLLLFYGMLSLAKALIVANKLNLFLEDIEYHGLHTRPVNDCLRFYKESPAKWSMELEYAVTNDGVFKHLTDILDDFTFENNSVFTFKDILSVCPEISKIYEKYYGEPSNTLYLYSHKVISESPYQFVLCPGEVDENEIYARIPELQEDFDLAPDILHEQARKLTSRGLNEIPNYMGLFQSPVGGNYMVGGLEYLEGETKKKRYINPAATDYIAMFILSICVRYKQDFWGSVINGERSGVLGLIELYITVIKRRYPNIILDSLFGEPFRYGSPTFYA